MLSAVGSVSLVKVEDSYVMQKAVFGAGCFWGVEATFRTLTGVKATSVGYAGGTTQNPTYEEVCSGTTGHAEVVEVDFDPDEISYDLLLETFWECHDPTTLNRQGPDVGTQYRSAIYVSSPAQEESAHASKARLEASDRVSRPVVTEVAPLATYWIAEDYHQQYFEKRRSAHRF
jgi:peptide-methionine (S)-S-oxide reductase